MLRWWVSWRIWDIERRKFLVVVVCEGNVSGVCVGGEKKGGLGILNGRYRCF